MKKEEEEEDYLNTCNFVILRKFVIKFYTATQFIVVKKW